eukprot:INCI7703.4.p1 GENE.INCI7703.4~~INCI7703.4.p1  ORF type:complete len:615 (+),score=67.28 INCI7703.4:127-1971(+)
MARSSMGTAAITCLLIASLREVCGTSGQWQQTPHVFCGLAPHPAANVTWGVTIQDCASVCLAAENCSAFAFTDPIWTGSPGCSLTEACSDPCRAGDCANWDLWVCKGGSSARDCGPIPSPLQVSPVLGSHMVLQRDVPNAIWGTITRGSTVVVRVSDGKGPSVNVSTVATSNDTFSVDIPARLASFDPLTITVSAIGQPSIVLEDVLVGDVFGCHGQSNMAFGLGQDINASAECLATANFPGIRFQTLSPRVPWQVAAPSTTCTGTGFSPFSAVCWYFGKNVFQQLGGTVPVGLVSSNVGGTGVQLWSSQDATAKCNQTGVLKQSTLFNSFIEPMLPLQLSGWIWYQGESNVASSKTWEWVPGVNCGIGCSETQPACDADASACASFYECQFPAMITDWREKFRGSGSSIKGRERGFLFVELAPYTDGADGDNHLAVAMIRHAQLAALRLPNTAMAAAFDYGDMASPLGNIHPRYKAPVGLRLARAARAVVYGNTSVIFKAPKPTSAQALNQTAVRISFDGPITVRAPPSSTGPCPVAPGLCGWLSVDGQNASVVGETSKTVIAVVSGGSSPVAPGSVIAYLQNTWPVPSLYRTADSSSAPGLLPVAPFVASVV